MLAPSNEAEAFPRSFRTSAHKARSLAAEIAPAGAVPVRDVVPSVGITAPARGRGTLVDPLRVAGAGDRRPAGGPVGGSMARGARADYESGTPGPEPA